MPPLADPSKHFDHADRVANLPGREPAESRTCRVANLLSRKRAELQTC